MELKDCDPIRCSKCLFKGSSKAFEPAFEASFELSGRPLLLKTLDFRPEVNVSEDGL